MKMIAIVIAVCVGGWYYSIGGRTLDERAVDAYYRDSAQLIHSKDPEQACKLLSRKVVLQDETVMAGQTQRTTFNYDQQCSATKELIASLSTGIPLDQEYQVDSIAITPDKKSATVRGTAKMTIAKTMQFTVTFEHQLVREMGQTKLLRSNQHTVMSPLGARAMAQSDFFSK